MFFRMDLRFKLFEPTLREERVGWGTISFVTQKEQ
jgi:hypothetical protein